MTNCKPVVKISEYVAAKAMTKLEGTSIQIVDEAEIMFNDLAGSGLFDEMMETIEGVDDEIKMMVEDLQGLLLEVGDRAQNLVDKIQELGNGDGDEWDGDDEWDDDGWGNVKNPRITKDMNESEGRQFITDFLQTGRIAMIDVDKEFINTCYGMPTFREEMETLAEQFDYLPPVVLDWDTVHILFQKQ